MFITALFTIARIWKQPRWPSTDEWIKKLWYINTMEYYSTMKRNAFESIPMRLDEPRAYHTEWSKPEREKQMPYIDAYIWNLERWYRWTCLQGSSGEAGIENSQVDPGQAKERVGGMNGESSMETHILSYAKETASGNLLYNAGSSNRYSVTT